MWKHGVHYYVNIALTATRNTNKQTKPCSPYIKQKYSVWIIYFDGKTNGTSKACDLQSSKVYQIHIHMTLIYLWNEKLEGH